MRYGLAPWGETLDELVDVAVRAERAGAAEVWTSEFARSSTITAAAIASATERVTVGTAITLAFVRSPLTLALEVLDLDELAGGRFVLGLGTGVKRLNERWHDADFDPAAARLAETVAAVRAVLDSPLDGSPVHAVGEHVRLELDGFVRPHPRPSRRIPIFMAAVGPLMLRTCGEVADGWISHELGSPEHLRTAVLPIVAEGAARAGRSATSVSITASACCVPLPDLDRARHMARPTIAFYGSVRTYQPFFAAHGFDREAVAIQERFRAGDLVGSAAAVTDEMVDAFCLCGPPDRVARRLHDYDGLANAVKLSPPTHHTAPADTRAAQHAIIDLLAELEHDPGGNR